MFLARGSGLGIGSYISKMVSGTLRVLKHIVQTVILPCFMILGKLNSVARDVIIATDMEIITNVVKKWKLSFWII